jgi:hypothetical protein
MSSSKFIHIEPELDSTNFRTWKQKMVLTLKSRRLWGVISGTDPKPKDKNAQDAWLDLDEDALTQIVLNIHDNHLSITEDAQSSANVWNAIQAEAVATKAFWTMQHSEGGDLQTHIS